MDEARTDLLELTAQVVTAHVGQNQVAANALPELIQSVYRAFATIDGPVEATAVAPTPAVPLNRSVFPDYIVCLEDGRRMKTLKRHLHHLGMTPEQYRAKWGLPRNYPMAAPNYTARRSEIAKALGLGRKPDDAADTSSEPVVTTGPARKARGWKG